MRCRSGIMLGRRSILYGRSSVMHGSSILRCRSGSNILCYRSRNLRCKSISLPSRSSILCCTSAVSSGGIHASLSGSGISSRERGFKVGPARNIGPNNRYRRVNYNSVQGGLQEREHRRKEQRRVCMSVTHSGLESSS